MLSDDVVDLVITTKESYLYVDNLSRKQASDLIRCWWDKRQVAMKGVDCCWRKSS